MLLLVESLLHLLHHGRHVAKLQRELFHGVHLDVIAGHVS
jgi:hypothetical protein